MPSIIEKEETKKVIESIDTFMPYFPLVPFYPIFIMIVGAFLIVKSRD